MNEWTNKHKSEFSSLPFKVFPLVKLDKYGTKWVPCKSKKLNLMFSYISFLVIMSFETYKLRKEKWHYISALLCVSFLTALSLGFLLRTLTVLHGSLWGLNELFVLWLGLYNEQIYYIHRFFSRTLERIWCFAAWFLLLLIGTICVSSEKLKESLN